MDKQMKKRKIIKVLKVIIKEGIPFLSYIIEKIKEYNESKRSQK